MKVKIFSDGSSRGNPGPGGYGTIIQYIDPSGQLHEKELSAGFKNTTNNRMELMGVIEGLKALNRPCQVEVVTDSKYVVDAFEKGWLKGWKKLGFKRKGGELLNPDLWRELDALTSTHQVHFNWVKGHDGHPENERCDKLATSAADGTNLLEDGFYNDQGSAH